MSRVYLVVDDKTVANYVTKSALLYMNGRRKTPLFNFEIWIYVFLPHRSIGEI